MYPDNYMNPMNNPMTNPNYGYNRMQQVQQMQRAINPQVPNMFGQVEQLGKSMKKSLTSCIKSVMESISVIG